jgi:hypothetical protein
LVVGDGEKWGQGLLTPVGFWGSCGRPREFLGRGEPCPGAKLDLSFSIGLGRAAFFGSVGQCPSERAGLPNT